MQDWAWMVLKACSQDKRAGISKKFCHSLPYFYTYPGDMGWVLDFDIDGIF